MRPLRFLVFFVLLALPGLAAADNSLCGCDTRYDNFCYYLFKPNGCGATSPYGVCDLNGDGNLADADWDAGWFAYQAECDGKCQCLQGIDALGRPISPDNANCGTKVCGLNDEVFECRQDVGWTKIGRCSDCRCPNGIDQNNRAIPVELTFCGYETCGNSGRRWRCSPSGSGAQWVDIGSCGDAPPTDPPPTDPPPTDPPPTDPPPTDPPSDPDITLNTGPNAKFGTNSAMWIQHPSSELADLNVGDAKNLGFHLATLGEVDDSANPADKVIPMIEAAHQRGVIPILRLCVAEAYCAYTDHPERVVSLIDSILSSGRVHERFYVIAGPNEPPRERWMYSSSYIPDPEPGQFFTPDDIATIANDMKRFSDVIVKAYGNHHQVKLLSPVFDCHNPYTPSLIRSLAADQEFDFHDFDGVGVNSYNLHGYLATRYFNWCRSYLKRYTGTMTYNYFQTETGMFETRLEADDGNAIPRSQGLDNLRRYFSVVRRESQLRASLLFNGNARSHDDDYDYNEISSSEWDYVLTDCGTNCPSGHSMSLEVGLDGFDGASPLLVGPSTLEKSGGSPWGPNLTHGSHASNPIPNNDTLGDSFGVYSPGEGELLEQLLSDRYEDGRLYTFRSVAVGSELRSGALPYVLGYAAVDDDPTSFQMLTAAVVDLDGHTTWIETDGVGWATAESGPEIGRQIMIRFGDDAQGGRGEVWVDQVEVISSLFTPDPPTSLVAAFATDPDLGVAPLTVTFTDTSIARGTDITSWAWDFDGDGTVDHTSTDPENPGGTFTFNEIGQYTPTLTVTDGQLEHTARYSNHIWATPTPSLDVTFTAGSTVGTAPFNVAFKDTSTVLGGHIADRLWDFDGDGTADKNEVQPTHTFEQPGTYIVTLTVTTDVGLSGSAELAVEVHELGGSQGATLGESFDDGASLAHWSTPGIIAHDSGSLRLDAAAALDLYSPYLVPAVSADDLYLAYQVRTDGGALPGVELELYDEGFNAFKRVTPFSTDARDVHGIWGPERTAGFYVDDEYWISGTPHVPAYLRVVFSADAGSTWIDNVWLSTHQRPEARIITYRGGEVGEIQILDATGSYDPDDGALSYRWWQVSGPSAPVLGTEQELAQIPRELEETGTVRVALQVTDAHGAPSLVVEKDVLTVVPAGTDVQCEITDSSAWSDSFLLDTVTITNHSSTPTSGWQMVLTFPHPVSGIDLWNGHWTLSSDGRVLTVTNKSWNGNIDPGESETFGLEGDHGGTFTDPTCVSVP